jgi:hypothetical protein
MERDYAIRNEAISFGIRRNREVNLNPVFRASSVWCDHSIRNSKISRKHLHRKKVNITPYFENLQGNGEFLMSPRYALLSLLITSMAGCATPYGGGLGIDYKPKQIPGSITVSDAKLYRREALINERRREVLYIDRLMAETEKEGFFIGPEINREIEVIQALALTAGLSFDPAAGRAYRDASETAAIQQDINVLQLQLQLDQLKRDAALFRDRLAVQTDPSSNDLGQPGAGPDPVTPPMLTPADTKDLVARIDTLQSALATRLGAEVKGLTGVSLNRNPIDQFRDRAAYRQILTAARNAASLDELHDLDGAALYRLNFQVTTLPPAKSHLSTAGIVEMRPVETELTNTELAEIYGRWLDHVYRQLNETRSNDPVRSDIEGVLAATGLFSVVQLLYDDGRPVQKVVRAGRKPPVPANREHSCPGLTSDNYPAGNCARLLIPVPDLVSSSVSFPGESRTMGEVVNLDISRLYDNSDRDLPKLREKSVVSELLEPQKCALRPASYRSGIARDSYIGQADTLVSAAVSASAGIPLLFQAMRHMNRVTASEQLAAALGDAQVRLLGASERARDVMEVLAATGCAPGQKLLPEERVVVPDRFRAVVVKAANDVRVYEVGPREQVQQVSTAARAAEEFSLAMALVTKAPAAGGGANAGLGYSRSAIGKVDVVERLPVVVGFAQARGSWENTDEDPGVTQPQFGWILGPRVNTVDPEEGSLRLQQGQKTYDLSADLAVSGWRTRLTLEVRTAWSPDWRSRDFVSALAPEGPVHHVTVNLRPSYDEFAALTTQLAAGDAGRGQRNVSINMPKSINACAATTIVIEGENLWRATDVIIGGQRISGDSLAVMPDMRGVTVEIPATVSYATPVVEVQVLTPYGVMRDVLRIDGHDPKGCGKPETVSEGSAVISVAPDVINICSSPTFTLNGRDLMKLTRVKFGRAIGALAKSGAKERDVSFTRKDLAQIASEVESMQFFVGEKELSRKAIRVERLNCSQGDE